MLRTLGVASVRVADAAAALAALRRASATEAAFDCALVDRQLHDDDGVALARAIRDDPAIADTRLILLGRLGHSLDVEGLQRFGLGDQLLKPVKFGRLRDILRQPVAGGVSERGRGGVAVDDTRPSDGSTLLSPKLRLLLVEDNLVNQKVALLQLKKLGLRADVVGNGQEAIAAMEDAQYDVVLMDCQMPEMDGFEATREIRAREVAGGAACPWRAPVRIVAMTANAMTGDRENCLAAGMDDYLSKPVNPAGLREALLRVVGPPALVAHQA
jgi:CheY-like chemotaxis protein